MISISSRVYSVPTSGAIDPAYMIPRRVKTSRDQSFKGLRAPPAIPHCPYPAQPQSGTLVGTRVPAWRDNGFDGFRDSRGEGQIDPV